MTPNELMYRLIYTPLTAQKVVAMDESGEHTFDVTGVADDDGRVVLALRRVAA